MMKHRTQMLDPMRPAYISFAADPKNKEKSEKRFASDMRLNNQNEIETLQRDLRQFKNSPDVWGGFKKIKTTWWSLV